MTEFTPEDAGRLMQRILFDEWRAQIAAGHLTEAGLLRIRTRLNATNEFPAGPDRELMLQDVATAIAGGRGIDPHDMPGNEVPRPPDDISGIE